MSENLGGKIKRLQSLDQREKVILDTLMADKKFKAIDLANSMGLPEGTFRDKLGNFFDKLGVPKDETDKRGYVFREYSEAYRELYLKVGEVQPTLPQINVTPPGRKINPTVVIIATLGGFLLISIIVIIGLVSIIQGLNQPAAPIPPTTAPLNTVAVPPTSVPIVPTSTPTITQTYTQSPIPPTATITTTPTITNTPTATFTFTPSFTPTITKTPIPTPHILFQDNFDNEPSLEWKLKSGNYSITNGRLGVLGNEPLQISIGDQTWKNYKVSFRVFNWSCSNVDSNFSFGIRGSSWTHKLIVAQVFGSDYAWLAQDGNSRSEITNTIFRPCNLQTNLIEVTAIGNKITFLDSTSFIIPGYDSGGVYLWMTDGILIDDFKVVEIP